MKKSIQNINAIAYKLKPVLTRIINYKLEVNRKKKWKKDKIVEKQKIKFIVVKCRKNRERINLYSKKKENYKNNIRNNRNSN